MKKIQLTRGMVAIVDDEDFESLNQRKWFAANNRGNFCACRVMRTQFQEHKIKMCNVIMNVPEGMVVNYKDGNRMNNRKENLRVCTKSQAQQNQKPQQRNKSSEYKGVSRLKNRGKWMAYIKVNGNDVYLGVYKQEIDAALAYDEAAEKYFGEFARPNFK